MAKVSANTLMIGTVACYLLGLIAFEAFIFRAVGDVSVAFLYTCVASAAIPSLAYGVGSIISAAPSFSRFLILALVHSVFYQSATHFLGLYGALAYSVLAVGVVFAAKFAEATDKRFDMATYVCGCLYRGFVDSLWFSDYACATCFALAFILSLVMLFLHVDAPAPGSIHHFLAVSSGKHKIQVKKHTNAHVLQAPGV